MNYFIKSQELILLNLFRKRMWERSSDSQICQCLSEILFLMKCKLNLLINEKPASNSLGGQSKINSQIAKYVQKIASLSKSKKSFLSIFQRFMLRVDQIVKQVKSYIPKHKVQLHVILKKMQIIANSKLLHQNYALSVCKLLEILIGNKGCLKDSKLMNNLQAVSQFHQTNYDFQVQQSNQEEKGLLLSEKLENLDSIENIVLECQYHRKTQEDQIICSRNKEENTSNHQQSVKIQILKKQKKKSSRSATALQDNSIVWQVRTSSFIQSNLMRPQSYRLKSKIQSERIFKATIESQETQIRTQKQRSYYNTCRLKQRVIPVNLSLLTIEDLPKQRLSKEGVDNKIRRFYFKSKQQNKYRFESHQQKSRKAYLKTMVSSLL